MTMVFLSHSNHTDTSDEIRSKLNSIVSKKSEGQAKYQEELKRFSEEDLANLLETRKSTISKNKKFILLMLLGLGGLAVYNKYELVMSHIASSNSQGQNEGTFDFDFG